MKSNALQLAQMRRAASSGEARALRLQAQLSLNDIAGACGVHPSTVFRWESGDRVPRGEPAVRYANFLEALTRAMESRVAS